MQGVIALPSKNQLKKYTHENHLNSSDQLYMQQTNKHQWTAVINCIGSKQTNTNEQQWSIVYAANKQTPMNSSDQLHMQQTNKHQRPGAKVGAWVQKVLEGAGRRGTTQKYFTHVQVARQPHLGQHLHVPLSQADIVMDWLMSTKKSFSEFENWTSS